MSLQDKLKTKKRQFLSQRKQSTPETMWEMLTTLAERHVKEWIGWAEGVFKKKVENLVQSVEKTQKDLVAHSETFKDRIDKDLQKHTEVLKAKTDREVKKHIETRTIEIHGEKGRDADEVLIVDRVLKRIPSPPTPISYEEIEAIVGSEIKKIKTPTTEEIQRIARQIQKELTPEEVKGKLKELPVREGWFDWRHLKNVPKPVEEEKTLHRGGQGLTVRASDLSGSTNGSTRTFTVPVHTRAILLTGSDYPNVYRITTDYTTSGTTLTIDSAIPAPSSGATLIFVYAV